MKSLIERELKKTNSSHDIGLHEVVRVGSSAVVAKELVDLQVKG